jgi:hypothetical protein
MGRFDLLTQLDENEPQKRKEKQPVAQPPTPLRSDTASVTPPPQALIGIKRSPDGKKPSLEQTGRRAKLSLSPALPDSEMVEKYTTHVEPSLVKKLQIEAVQKDINDYDVVRIALKEYFERKK